MLKLQDLGFLAAIATSGCCYANPPEADEGNGHSALPSRELLEFMAEFEAMDDEDFDLLVAYARRDRENARPGK